MSAMWTLFHTPGTCSTASHIALEEAERPYEAQLVKLWKPEEHEKYRATINPNGSVPALRVGDALLTENVAILSHIALQAPEKNLLPREPLALAQCLSFMAWLASSVQIARRQARAPQRFTPDESAHEALKAAGAEAVWKHMTTIDRRLEGKLWIMGDQYTIADGYALVFYNWGVMDERDMASLTHFTAFKERMVQRAPVRRVLEKERSVLVAA